MDRTGTLEFLWFYAMSYVTMVLNYSALESLNWITPYQACFGTTPDISALLQFYFYQPIYYAQENSFPNVKEQFGHWLGVAENKGDALTYYILTENKQILVHLLVRPITNTEAKLRCPTSTILHNSNASEIEKGSNGYNNSKSSKVSPEKLSLDMGLLSELVNSNAPEFDPMQVNWYNAPNGQELYKFIGVKFVFKDKCNVSFQAKVIKVNKETGKVMLKYVHGGLELVKPNKIQELTIQSEKQVHTTIQMLIVERCSNTIMSKENLQHTTIHLVTNGIINITVGQNNVSRLKLRRGDFVRA